MRRRASCDFRKSARGFLPLLVLLLILASCGEHDPRADAITVFAAASAADVMTDLTEQYQAETGVEVKLSLAASSTLARQIAHGADADIFLSANPQWMDYLAERDLIDPATRRNLLANALVIVAPSGSAVKVRFDESFEMPSTGVERIAIGDPAHVPSGIYGMQALERLGWTDDIEDLLLIPCPDVRAALRLAELGEVDLAIVYASDAHRAKKVELIATFPSHLHDPILYPIAAVKDATGRAAAFLSFLSRERSMRTMKAHGFRPP